MTINSDSALFKAILSMDSYNRGYNAGVDLNQHDENGDVTQASDAPNVTHIGAVTVIANSGLDFSGDDQTAGFYSLAYQLPDSSVTIAYRGTDQAIDALSYLGGAGATMTQQSTLAIQFYHDVATQLGSSDDISLTGHSLGGGLAGLVGALYDKPAALFDNMAFEAAAHGIYENATETVILPGGEIEYPYADQKQFVYGSAAPWAPVYGTSSSIHTDYVDGQFLTFNLAAQTTPKTSISLGTDVDLPGFDGSAYYKPGFAFKNISGAVA